MSQDAIQPIPRQRYFNNQLLYATDFQREQAYAEAHRELQTRLFFAPGVLAGLEVTAGAPGRARLAPGAALDAAGRAILLVDRATLAGAPLAAEGGGFAIDLSALSWQGRSWLLTLTYGEAQDPGNANQILQLPTLALVPAEGGAPVGTLALTTLAVSRPTPPPTTEPPTPPTPPTVTVDAAARAAVTLWPARLPPIDAARIVSGALDPARIPPLDAAKIADGTLDPARLPVFGADSIPPLDAAKIATGELDPARIPVLDAAKIATGVLDATRIPPLDAGGIATGILAVERIPDLPASKIVGGGGGASGVGWASGIAFWPVGLGVGSRVQASGGAEFWLGLLKTDTDRGRSVYALGIAFSTPVLAWSSPEVAAAGVRADLYPDRTRYSLAAEGGQPGEGLVRVRFVGVTPELGFDLHTPESELPPESRGRIAGLVVIGSRAADSAAVPPLGAGGIVDALRDGLSPFGFAALASPAATAAPTPAVAAAELRAQGRTAQDAAPLLAALQPGGFADAAPPLLSLLATTFPESTATVAQAAWSLALAGISPAAASAALGAAFQGRAPIGEIGAALSGAYPAPSVQALVVQLQGAGRTAQDAAPALRAASPQFTAAPLPLGITLRTSFPETSGTPLDLARSLRSAGYLLQPNVIAAVQQLFPDRTAADAASAVAQAFESPPPVPSPTPVQP